ncbi:hypothetical protein DENSPDRAFT_337382 [Dentipellis sp. KUC8613]|nr:hypothetical protein DENSPDRAFT_337382 [Dentipellis sp. KUC8613]
MDSKDGQLSEDARIRDIALSKQRRNASSLVCSSPPEILQHIFQFYIHAKVKRGPPGPAQHAPPRSAVLTHVCRRWRDVCLNDRRLWTTISSSMNRQWQSEYVARSGDSPLAMNIFLGPPHEENILAQAAIDHIHRLRVLLVHGSQGVLQTFINSLVNKAAPILESLTMRTHRAFTLTDAEHCPIVPADIFAGTAPRLQSLAVHWVRLSGPSVRAFTSLTTIQGESPLSALDTWMLLSSTTHIKAAKFFKLNNIGQGHPFHHNGRIYAPALSEVEVNDVKPAILIKMLENLVAPSLSQIALCGIRLYEWDLDFFSNAISRALSAHFQLLRQKRGPMEDVLVDPEQVVCWPIHDDRHHRASPFHIAWVFYPSSADAVRLLNSVISILPVHEARTLFVDNHEWYPETRGERWACLYPFQNVTDLNFTSLLATEALYMLLAMTTPDQRIDIGKALPLQDHILFPHLRKLVFSSMSVRPHGGAFLRVLSCMVRSRRRSGTILEIAFQHCSYSAVAMAQLKKDALVTWDGVWCPPFSFGDAGEDPELENWEGWGSMFDQQPR